MTVKFRHIALLMTVALTISCSKDDSDMNAGNGEQHSGMDTPIVFMADQQNGETVTRAESLEDYVTTFTVYGYKNMSYESGIYGDLQQVFPGYIVNWTANSAYTTTTNTDGWEYVGIRSDQTIKYWDWSAKAYRFFGYAGEGVTVAPSSPASTPSEVSLSFTANAAEPNPQADPVTYPSCPYYSKLWFSTGEYPLYADKQFGAPVQLLFLMPYVRVRFLFTQSAPDDVNFYKKEISFAPTDPDTKIATGGTFTVTYPLTGTETKESWGVSVTGLVTIDELTQDDDVDSGTPVLDDGMWYIVLPAHAADQGSYTLSVKISGETRTVVVPQEFMDWQPGYEYTYIFKITDAGGVVLDGVVPGFSPWTTVIKDRDIYNW